MPVLDQINSRPPTGKVPWPCILLEGEEKAGKTYAAYQLTGSDRVGDSFVIDLGEGSADEYAPLGDYQVVEPRDGGEWTFRELLHAVATIREHAGEQVAAGAKPVVLIVDSMSAEWGVLVDAITAKASQSKANKEKLANDPAAEVKVPNLLWNGANAKHRRLMTLLLTFPGIVILTARGKEVAEIRNGAPVEGSKVWKVEGQKNLGYDVTAWIRMKRTTTPTLEGCRSLRIGVRPGYDRPLDLTAGSSEWAERGLEWFIFDGLGVDPGNAAVRDLRDLQDDGIELPSGVQPMTGQEFLTAHVVPAWDDVAALGRAYSELVARGLYDATVTGPSGEQVALGTLVQNRGAGLRMATEQAALAEQGVPAAPGQPQTPQEAPREAQGHTEPQDAAQTPIARPESDAETQLLEHLLAEAAAATTVDDVRAVWRASGQIRSREVTNARGIRMEFGRYLMERQAEVAEQPEPVEQTPAPQDAAAGETRRAVELNA